MKTWKTAVETRRSYCMLCGVCYSVSQAEGYRFKWSGEKHLIAKTPLGKESSLGPLGEKQRVRGLVGEVRGRAAVS